MTLAKTQSTQSISKISNSKLEIRNSKQIRMTKMQNNSISRLVLRARIFVFARNTRPFVNCFEH